MIPRTPTFETIVRSLIEIELQELHTSLPGRVVKLNKTGNKIKSVDVRPEVRRVLGGKETAFPVIRNVPIYFLQADVFVVTIPVKVNDKVMIFFSERSIDEWLANGKEKMPRFRRRHALTDAFAIPIKHFGQGAYIDDADMVIGKPNGRQIRVTADDRILIGSNTSSQPVPLTFKLLKWLSNVVIITPMGPARIDPASLATFSNDVGSTKVFAE